MREDSPRWEEINRSEHAHERAGLRELASYLPDADPYHVWANVEFTAADGSVNEIDALVLTPSGLVVLELKHWQGEIKGDGVQWVQRPPTGRLTPHDNPYILTNRKAKRLASLIRQYGGAALRGRVGYVRAAVFLHARLLDVRDLDQVGRTHVYGLDGNTSGLPSLKEFLLAEPLDPVDGQLARQIVTAVRKCGIRPSVANRKVGPLLLHPRPFAEGVGWQDFLAGHTLHRSLTRRVRFYLTSRAPEEDLPAIRRAAEREFGLMQGIRHPGIASPLELYDHEWGPALSFEHPEGAERLDHWLRQREGKLTLAQKLLLVQQLAEIVDYAHSRRLAHRALNPTTVWVTDPDSPRPGLLITDWQSGGRLPGSTQMTRLGSSSGVAGLEFLHDDEVLRYQAPELATNPQADGVQADVFSLGAIAYRVFTGHPPAPTPEELVAAVQEGGLNPAAVVDGLPEPLVQLVYGATHGDPGPRLKSTVEFRQKLDGVWEELTAPEPEPTLDPLQAGKGDVLDGRFTVERRLGAGATAVALLVNEPTLDGPARKLVLKVARDEQHRERLEAEAQVLKDLRHPLVAALVQGPLVVGGRTALLLESAGERTLADELRQGRLALGLLERYGRDLLRILYYLEGQGVWHRDLKPANLAARPHSSDGKVHLCVFDFSLAAARADDLTAGTRPYLDPFLGPPGRIRYDSAAERFAAAVTLYEMATGTLPRWGEANPATVSTEVTLDPALFDPAVADRLVGFFTRALARQVEQRFATVEEMEDAWRRVFAHLPEAPPEPDLPVPVPLRRESPVESLGFTPQARSALQRLGITTLGELLDRGLVELSRATGVPDATRREIRERAQVLRTHLPAEPAADEDTLSARGVDAVAASLLPKRVPNRNADELAALRVLLGQAATPDGRFLSWPPLAEVAEATGQVTLSGALRRQIDRWRKNRAVSQVRDELVLLLDSRGGVMSARELAEGLIAARGSYAPEPRRLPQAIGLVRAAVETELALGMDSRVAYHRLPEGAVLVGQEPVDPDGRLTADDLLQYAVRLGQRAEELVGEDPLPTGHRAADELRQVPAPDGAPVWDDIRLLQIAAEASDRVDLNPQGQLYPVGMPAMEALRLSMSNLTGYRLDADALRARVRVRFPRAEPLPPRPALDDLLVTVGVPLRWDAAISAYTPRTAQGETNSTRMLTAFAGGSAAAASDVDERLRAVVTEGRFLAVLTPLRQFTRARAALRQQLGLTEVDVTAILLERLRALNYPWQDILTADTGDERDPNFQTLVEIVHTEVMPAVRQALATPEPLLVTEAGPLARYDALGPLRELADISRPRPAARLLLVPASSSEPRLDGEPLPLTSPASQSLWLPESWLTAHQPVG